MPAISVNPGRDSLLHDGPLLCITVDRAQAAKARLAEDGQSAPPATQVMALIDSGAGMCGIDRDLAVRLGLPPVGQEPVLVPTDDDPCTRWKYQVRLEIPDLGAMTVTAVEAELASQGFHIILGRDFLSCVTYVYSGRDGSFTLSSG